MKRRLNKIKNRALLNKFGIGAVALGALFLYLTGTTIESGWVTYAIQLPALFIIAVTALARVNDISENKKGHVWNLRRLGLSFSGAAAVSMMFTPWMYEEFPSWRGLLLAWGFAMTWITTPDQPPWWKKITHYLGEGK